MNIADQNLYSKDKLSDKHFSVTLRKDGIMHVEIAKDHTLNLEDTIKTVDSIGRLGGGSKYPILITGGSGASSADHESREYSSTEEGCRYTLADAIVIKSISQKMIANFYLRFYKLVVPTKIFTDIDEAVAWLKEIRTNQLAS